MRGPAVVVLLLVAGLCGSSTASAGGGRKSIDPSVARGAFNVHAEYQRDGTATTRQVVNQRAAVPQWSYARIPACPGNSIEAGVDDPCPQAEAACAEPGVFQWWLYRAPYRATDPIAIGEPGWLRIGTICVAPDAAGTDPVVPAYSLTEFRRLPLPAGETVVEPADWVLVTMPTNVFATSTEPVLLDTTLAGIAITVRATPTRWSWDFGDGAGRIGPTDDPGAPYPALTHTYAYPDGGRFAVTMTTHYTGEYSLDGGSSWLPIVGEATVDGAPVPVVARTGRSVLVDGPVQP